MIFRSGFLTEVETWLLENNFKDAGNLTKIVRNSYDASDSPGISAIDGVQYLINMRQFYLGILTLDCFPLKGGI